MDINKLSHAVAVAREGSFAAAAASIPLSQSALTRSIQSLERKYGMTLLDRRKSGARLTRDGERFIEIAEEFIRNADRTEKRLFEVANGEDVTVRFGAGPVVTTMILPVVMSQLADSRVKFEIRAGSNTTLRSLLRRGEIDFFLGGVPKRSDNFASAYGFRIEFVSPANNAIVVVMRAGHPLSDGPLVPERLRGFPVACDSFVSDRFGSDGLTALGLQSSSVEIDDYHVLAELVSKSDFLLVANWSVDASLFPCHNLVVRTLITPSDIEEDWRWAFVSSSRAPMQTASSAVLDVMRRHIRGVGRAGSSARA